MPEKARRVHLEKKGRNSQQKTAKITKFTFKICQPRTISLIPVLFGLCACEEVVPGVAPFRVDCLRDLCDLV